MIRSPANWPSAHRNFSPQLRWHLLIILTAWLAFVAWRPFSFGFYHDDWASIAVPLERSPSFMKLFAADATRPLYTIIDYLLRVYFAESPFVWQLLLALVHLTCAFVVYRIATELVAWLNDVDPSEEAAWIGCVGAIFWLIFPWSLGYTAWAVMLAPMIGMALALWGIMFALRIDRDRSSVTYALICFAFSWAIYEATWFAWVPAGLVAILRAHLSQKNSAYELRLFGALLIVQAIFVAGNRIVSALGDANSKSFSGGFLSLFVGNVKSIIGQLLPSSLKAGKYLFIAGLIGLLICAFINTRMAQRSIRTKWLFLALGVGVIFSTMLYTAAGYAIVWDGLFSRTTMQISLWLALALTVLFSLAWWGARKRIKLFSAIALVLICAPLAVSLHDQSQIWKKSWKEQLEILHAIPESMLNAVDSESLILMDVPTGTAPVFTFTSFWDINGAVLSRMDSYPATEPHVFATVLRRGEWRTTWDGHVVKQYWCGQVSPPLWALKASRVYLWEFPSPEGRQLSEPFDSGCPEENS